MREVRKEGGKREREWRVALAEKVSSSRSYERGEGVSERASGAWGGMRLRGGGSGAGTAAAERGWV